MHYVARTQYQEILSAFKDKKIIKVITGVRRCGKTTLMEMFRSQLLESGVQSERIVSLNFEDYDNWELRDPKKLHDHLKSFLSSEKMTYFFLDEIQHVTDFVRVVDSLFIRDNVDIYITGSNANLLSSEIATMLSGRYIEVKMLPLSFTEFRQMDGEERSLSESYKRYIESSSFPYIHELPDQKAIRTYLEGIFSTVLLKDILQRLDLREPMLLESVTRFIFDNVGSQLSTTKIANTLTSNGRRVDTRTVEKYLDGLLAGYLIYEAKPYNIKGRELLKRNEKYYLVDIALRSVLLGKRAMDVGHILENVIFLELLRRGYTVYVGKVGRLEIDFVASNESTTLFIQVAATVRDSETLKRELASLEAVNNHYPKLLLTLDDDPEMDYDGIRKVNALQWLTNKVR